MKKTYMKPSIEVLEFEPAQNVMVSSPASNRILIMDDEDLVIMAEDDVW